MSWWRRLFLSQDEPSAGSNTGVSAEEQSFNDLLTRYSASELSSLFTNHGVYKDRDGWLLIGSYQAAVEALQSESLVNAPSRFSALHSSKSEQHSSAFWAQCLLPFLDGSEHRSMRSDVAAPLLESVRQQAAGLDQCVAEGWQGFEKQGSGDFFEAFASPLMWQLISGILGIDEKQMDWREAKSFSRSFFYLFSLLQSESERQILNRDLEAFSDRLESILAQMSDQPNALCTRWCEQYGRTWAVANLMLLIADAMNADYMLANALLAVSQQPDFLLEVKQTEAWKQGADELIRFDSPSLYIARRAGETMRIGGETLRADAGILIMLAVANRDAREFEDPDRLRLRENSDRFLSMGKGAHACLGRLLVSDTLQACLRQWASTSDDLPQLSPGLYELRSGHRWLTALDCDFG